MGKKANIVVGLDLGTTKTCVIVGEVKEQGIDIVGVGTQPSEGILKGVVVNIDSTVEAIRGAVEEARKMSGCDIRSVCVGVGGNHIRSQDSLGIVAVKGREVSEDDVQRAVEASRAIPLSKDSEILHTLPQSFVVDQQDGIRDPVGMAGVRLEAKVHIVTGVTTRIQNVVKSVNRVGLDVDEVVLGQLGAAEAVLGADEKELGVALVDIGGGTTDVAVFAEGSVRRTVVIPVGGQYLTSDISQILRTPPAEAERIKIHFGCVHMPLIPKDDVIEVPSVGGREPREVSRQILVRIMESRMEEILGFALQEIAKSGLEDSLTAGVVLTGGTAMTPGVCEMAEQIFNMPVRIGTPVGVGGLTDVVNDPSYATGVGLVLYGARNFAFNPRGGGFLSRAWTDLRNWFLEFF